MRRLFWMVVIGTLILSAACVRGNQPDSANQANQSNFNSTASAPSPQPSATDAELKSKVEEELAADPRTSGHNIAVDAASGTITLSGKVDSEETKAAASEAAGKVSTGVNNQLQVAPEAKRQQAEVSDKDIQTALDKLVNEDEKVSGLSLIWTVKNGVVSLDGVVETNDQLGYAVQAISKIPGVKSVKKGNVTVLNKEASK